MTYSLHMYASWIDHTGKEWFTFGKYKHKLVSTILKQDPKYIKWIKENTRRRFSKHIENEIIRLKILN